MLFRPDFLLEDPNDDYIEREEYVFRVERGRGFLRFYYQYTYELDFLQSFDWYTCDLSHIYTDRLYRADDTGWLEVDVDGLPMDEPVDRPTDIHWRRSLYENPDRLLGHKLDRHERFRDRVD